MSTFKKVEVAFNEVDMRKSYLFSEIVSLYFTISLIVLNEHRMF